MGANGFVSILSFAVILGAIIFVFAALWQILRTQGEILSELKRIRGALEDRERERA